MQDGTDTASTTSGKMPDDPITVTPHGSEGPLRLTLVIIGVILWVVILVSVIGIFYGLFFALMFLFAQIMLVVHLRGSSVKLGPKQLPGLYKRIVNLSDRVGMKKVPDAYLVQSGGVLNAFATRFGWRNFIVLYSDMVRACGDNMDALDFIIGHELGHLHRGHLRWRWLKAPALAIPFLGGAYYRACEYTCDRYGSKACNDPKHRLSGLCLLAGGPRYGAMINQQEFVAQTADMNTPVMKLGSWFGTHPPLVCRAAALEPELVPAGQNGLLSTLGGIVLAALVFVVPIGGAIWAFKSFEHTLQEAQSKLKAAKPAVQEQDPVE